MTWLVEAKEAIKSSSKDSSVYVGADSRRFKKNDVWYAKYTTVVVLHRDSKHGCKIYHSSEVLQDFGNIKQRLLTEVSYAVAAATEIIDVVGDRHLEIHIDINPSPKHKSSVAVKEALGWVKGSLGIDAVVKPNAWAASHCGDHMVRL